MTKETTMVERIALPDESPRETELMLAYTEYIRRGGKPPAHYLGAAEDCPEFLFDKEQLCALVEQLVGEAIERGEL